MSEIISSLSSKDDLLTLIMHTSSTVWENELIEKDIKKWLNNFTGEVFTKDEEQLLALWLLCNFTFYNQKEVTHLCTVLYKELIHEIVKDTDDERLKIISSINAFFQKTNIISPGKTSDSGGFIAYFFRHANHLPMKIFNFSLHNVGDNIDNLLVIDDVTLTAGAFGQAYDFFKKASKKFIGKKIILLTLIASQEAIDVLKNDFNINVISTIKLDDRDKCFNIKSSVFNHCPELIDKAKQFAEHYGKKIFPSTPLGFQDGQYIFGFFYNVPDNTLPIFWGNINNWIPIVKRFNKNYSLENYFKHERFI